MATITQNLTVSASSNEYGGVSGVLTDTGDSAILIDVVLPALVTDVQDIACSFVKTDLQSIFMVCSADVEIGFTGGSASISLLANMPYVWSAAAGYTANPFSNNVTGMTAAATDGGRLQVRLLVL